MKRVKVKEINLEKGSPLVEDALRNMVNSMATAKREGYKACILIHGYGSSGEGGAIKEAVVKKLKDPSLRGVVSDFVQGENWNSKKNEFLNHTNQLKDFERYIGQNKGVTVVIFRP